jgi:hypothetical protein
MRRSLVVALLAGSTAGMTACSLSTSLEGFSSSVVYVESDGDATERGGEDVIDAAADAPVDSNGLDAGDVSGAPNLHPQSTFENGTCAPWYGYQGATSFSATAHTGTGACRICTLPSTTDFFTADDTGVAGAAAVGATYRASAWARTDPAAPGPGPVTVYLRSFAVPGGTFTSLERGVSPSADLGSQWQRLEATLTITKPDGTINVFIGGAHRANACFLIDDVVLQRVD